MFDLFLDFAKKTQEYKSWGLNLLTFGFLGTAFLGFYLQLPAMWKQFLALWWAGKAEGVSPKLMTLLLFYLAIFLVYGFETRSAGDILNAILLTPVQILIMLRLSRIRQFNWHERLLFWACVGATILDLLLPYKVEFYLVTMFVTVAGPFEQAVQILRTKTSEGFHPALAKMFTFVAGFWIFYSLTLGDFVLAAAAVLFAAAYGSIWFACTRYPSRSALAVA